MKARFSTSYHHPHAQNQVELGDLSIFSILLIHVVRPIRRHTINTRDCPECGWRIARAKSAPNEGSIWQTFQLHNCCPLRDLLGRHRHRESRPTLPSPTLLRRDVKEGSDSQVKLYYCWVKLLCFLCSLTQWHMKTQIIISVINLVLFTPYLPSTDQSKTFVGVIRVDLTVIVLVRLFNCQVVPVTVVTHTRIT